MSFNPPISQRLSMVMGLIPPDQPVVDMGTDHAYLAIGLRCADRVPLVVAVDRAEKPLAVASRHIAKSGVSGVRVRLSEGLENVDIPPHSTLVVAGMGGENIIEILSHPSQVDRFQGFVLQPNRSLATLRYWLGTHGFGIHAVQMCVDNGLSYTAFYAQKGSGWMYTNHRDAYICPLLLAEDCVLHRRWMLSEVSRLHAITARPPALQHQLDWLLTELRDHH